MLWNLVFAVAFGMTAMWMVRKAKRFAVRRMAFVPLAACTAELITCGVLAAVVSPVLTVMLLAARLGVLGCCAAAMKRDAAEAKARARRRSNYLRAMQNVMLPPLRLVSRRCADVAAEEKIA